jgi:hypothetical protein
VGLHDDWRVFSSGDTDDTLHFTPLCIVVSGTNYNADHNQHEGIKLTNDKI